MSRIDSEKRTVAKMIHIYCCHYEGNKNLCDDCASLLDYANARLSRCPHGEHKPTCRKCPIHCYRPDMKARMKDVMRFSGPRMLIYAPIEAIKHSIRELWELHI